tara:strand:- start:119 stop:343 length:225 start_codon:yes stop_codon:yes gene_type:complete
VGAWVAKTQADAKFLADMVASISSLMEATMSARSTGFRKYCTVIAVPSLASSAPANAASTIKLLRLLRLSVTQN